MKSAQGTQMSTPKVISMFNYEQISKDMSSLLFNPQTTFEEVVGNANVQLAFRKQHMQLIQFLIQKIEKIVNTAVGIEKSDIKNGQEICFFFLTTPSPTFTSLLTTNRTFLNCLNNAINIAETIGTGAVTIICSILDFHIQSSNGFIFIHFPEKELLFAKLVKFIKNSSAFSLLHTMTYNSNQVLLDYLQSTNASKVLFNQLGDDDFTNASILKILLNMASTRVPGSALVFSITTLDNIKKFLEIAIDRKFPKTSLAALNLLFKLSRYFNDYSSDDSEVDIVDYLQKQIPLLCKFVEESEDFTPSKQICVVLMIRLIMSSREVDDCILHLFGYLFDQFFLLKKNSFLHCTFLLLFKSILDRCPQIIVDYKMRERIIEASQEKNAILASYWGHVHQIVGIILGRKNEIPNNDQWNEYVEKYYNPAMTIINSNYGGAVPHPQNDKSMEKMYGKNMPSSIEDDSSDEEYEYYEEEEEEEEEEEYSDSEFSLDVLNKSVFPESEELACAVFTPIGDQLILAAGNLIEVYQVSNEKFVFEKHVQGKINTLQFSPDGTKLLCGVDEDHIYVISFPGGSIDSTLDIPVTHFKMARNGKFFAVIHDKDLTLYDYPANTEIKTMKLGSDAADLSISPDNNNIAIGCKDGSCVIWNVPTGSVTACEQAHNKPITAIIYNGNQIITSSRDSSIKIWQVSDKSLKLQHSFTQNTSAVVSISTDLSRNLILSGSEDKSFRIFNIRENHMTYSSVSHSGTVTTVLFHPTKQQFITGSADYLAKLWCYSSKT